MYSAGSVQGDNRHGSASAISTPELCIWLFVEQRPAPQSSGRCHMYCSIHTMYILFHKYYVYMSHLAICGTTPCASVFWQVSYVLFHKYYVCIVP